MSSKKAESDRICPFTRRPTENATLFVKAFFHMVVGKFTEQVRDKTAFSIHFFIVHHIKITIHLPYFDLKLVSNNNTKIKYILKDCTSGSLLYRSNL